jgi:hypothetical protein
MRGMPDESPTSLLISALITILIIHVRIARIVLNASMPEHSISDEIPRLPNLLRGYRAHHCLAFDIIWPSFRRNIEAEATPWTEKMWTCSIPKLASACAVAVRTLHISHLAEPRDGRFGIPWKLEIH